MALAAELHEDLPGLMEELEDIERRRTGSGNLQADLASRRQHVISALIDRLTGRLPDEAQRAAERVRCDLLVRVGAGEERTPGAVKDLFPGGLFVETAHAAERDALIDLEVAPSRGTLEHGLRVRARVIGLHPAKPGRPAGLSLVLPVTDEAGERRVARLVDAIVRSRLGQW